LQTFDSIVVGLGAMGSAALYHLAKRGHRVLGIDRHVPPHPFGSTHGDTRITRLAIGEGAHYTPLVIRSHELWRILEAESGRTLLTTNGGLVISSAARSSKTHVDGFFENTVAAARRFDIEHEILDARDIRRRYPQFNVADDEAGYFEPTAGFVRPEGCVGAHLEQAEARGAVVAANETANALDASSNGVTITTDRAAYMAEQVVVAAGPWLASLVDRSLSAHFAVYRQVMVWFDAEDHWQRFRPEHFPVFIWELQGRRQGIYGFPAIDGSTGGVKVATEQFDADTTPEAVERAVSREEIAQMHEQYVAPFVRGLGARSVKASSCLYTATPDFGFVVDRHPASDRVLIVSACSGHGFKHSAAIGEAVSELVADGVTRFDLDAFKLRRFIER